MCDVVRRNRKEREREREFDIILSEFSSSSRVIPSSHIALSLFLS